MLLKIYYVRTEYSRLSKHGIQHTYFRNCKTALLLCDNCNTKFERLVSQMDHRRLTPDHTHVCPMCNPKKFAQHKGVEARRFWNTTVDADKDIDEL